MKFRSQKFPWIIASALVFVGSGSAIMRYAFPQNLHYAIASVFYGGYVNQLPVLAEMPIKEFIHRIGGSIYFIIGLVQFSTAFRMRHPKVHRLLGKTFLILSLLVGGSGILFSIVKPFSGFMETIPTVLFGGLFLYFGFKAYKTAKDKRFVEHREWMIRNFSLGLGIATIRLYALPLIQFSTLDIRDILVLTFWLGWSTNMVIAEWWIRDTRTKVMPGKIAFAG